MDAFPPTPPPLPQKQRVLGGSPERWTRWLIFILLVGAVAVFARRTNEARLASSRDGDVVEAQEPEPPAPPEPPAFGEPPRPVLPFDPRSAGLAGGDASSAQPVTTLAEAGAVPDASPSQTDGSTGSGTRLRRTYGVDSGATIDIEVDHADVLASAATDRNLSVTAELASGASASDLHWSELETSRSRVRIELKTEGGASGVWSLLGGRGQHGRHGHGNDTLDRIVVSIPDGMTTRLHCGAGEIHVRALKGVLEIETGAGDVEVQGMSGRLQAESGAGDVTIKDAHDEVAITTGAGDVLVEGSPSPLKIETGAGDIDVKGPIGRAHLESGMGGIDVEVPHVTDRLDAETGMGGIDVTIGGGGFKLDAESGMGNVALDDQGREERSDGMGGSIKHDVGGGGPVVHLESGAGGVDVTRK